MNRMWRLGVVACAALGLALPMRAQAETVRMTVSYYSAATGPYFEKMAQEFHAANPSIDVKIEVVNWPNLLQKLQTDISAGANADISIIGTRWLLDFVKDGIAEPVRRPNDDPRHSGGPVSRHRPSPVHQTTRRGTCRQRPAQVSRRASVDASTTRGADSVARTSRARRCSAA